MKRKVIPPVNPEKVKNSDIAKAFREARIRRKPARKLKYSKWHEKFVEDRHWDKMHVFWWV